MVVGDVMALRVVCVHCGATVEAADESAGKLARCGKCLGVITVPRNGDGKFERPPGLPEPPILQVVPAPASGVRYETKPLLGRGAKRIICPNPNCGFEGIAEQTARGSVGLGFLLSLFFLLPGIIYFIFMQGYRYNCPRCGVQISADL